MYRILYVVFICLISCTTEKPDIVCLVQTENGKWGYIDSNDNWYIQPNFDDSGYFLNGFTPVLKDSLQGILNSDGELVVPIEFERVSYMYEGKASVFVGDTLNYMDSLGNFISDDWFNDGGNYSEGLAAVQSTENFKFGYIDAFGKLVVPFQFVAAGEFINGRAYVIDIEDKAKAINKEGGIIGDTIPPMLTKVPIPLSERKFRFFGSSENSTLGLIYKGDTIMDSRFQGINFNYHQNGVFTFNEKDRVGLADTLGHIILEAKYDGISPFSKNGLALVQKDNKYGYINYSGDLVIGLNYSNAQGFSSGLAAVESDDLWGFINSEGDIVIEPKYADTKFGFRPMDVGEWSYAEFDNKTLE